MTELEWDHCESPQEMLWILVRNRSAAIRSNRRLFRLLAAAWVRSAWGLMADPQCRRSVLLAEQFADGLWTEQQREDGVRQAQRISSPASRWASIMLLSHDTHNNLRNLSEAVLEWVPGAAQADAIRDLFQKPGLPKWTMPPKRCQYCGRMSHFYDLCPSCIRCDCHPWQTPDVLSMAKAAYNERPGRECETCRGKGSWTDAAGDFDSCHACSGAGRVEDGALDPHRLDVLADALEEAGCEDGAILSHLRGQVGCKVCGGGGVLYETVALSSRRDCHHCGGLGLVQSPPHFRGCRYLDAIFSRRFAVVS
jgi:hypothetical protein